MLTTNGRQLGSLIDELVEGQVNDDEGVTRADVIERIAGSTGRDAGTINGIIDGDPDCPPLEVLSGIASALDTNADRLRQAAESDGCSYEAESEAENRGRKKKDDDDDSMRHNDDDLAYQNKTVQQTRNEGLKNAFAKIAQALGFKINQDEEGEMMDKAQLIEQIMATEGVPLTPAMLEAASPEELELLLASLQGAQVNEDETETGAEDATGHEADTLSDVTGDGAEAAPGQVPVPAGGLTLPAEFNEFATMITDLGGIGAIKETLTSFKVTADQQFNDLLGLITTNSNFERAELKGLPVEHLQKLAANISQPTPDYSGRGGGLQAAQDEWSYGWDTQEVQ